MPSSEDEKDLSLFESIEEFNFMALHEAIVEGRVAVLEMLQERFVDVSSLLDERNANGQTALHLAISHSQDLWVCFLLTKHADPNAVDAQGRTPVHLASLDPSHCVLLERLLVDGGDPNIKDRNGHTPLHLAAVSNNIEAVQALVCSEGDPNIRDNTGMTPLLFACLNDYYYVADFLLDPSSLSDDSDDSDDDSDDDDEDDEEDDEGGSDEDDEDGEVGEEDDDDDDARQRRKAKNKKKKMKEKKRGKKEGELIAADATIADNVGRTPLHAAVYAFRDDSKLVDKLLQSGADIDTFDDTGRTALFWAIMGTHELECIKMLLDLGSDLSHKDVNGFTVLHYACHLKLSSTVRLLLQRETDDRELINELTVKHNISALHFGAAVPHIVQELLTRDADVLLEDTNRQTPLFWAVKAQSRQSFEMMLEKARERSEFKVDHQDRWGRSLLHYSVIYHDLENFKELIGLKANIKLNDVDKKNIIHFAARFNNIEVLQYLRDNFRVHLLVGLLTATDSQGRKPGHLAAASGSREFLSLLQSMKAHAWGPDKFGALPIHYAATASCRSFPSSSSRSSPDNYNECLQYFIENTPSEVTKVDHRGRNALHAAIFHDSQHTIQHLIESTLFDLHVRDNSGRSYLFYAQSSNVLKKLLTAITQQPPSSSQQQQDQQSSSSSSSSSFSSSDNPLIDSAGSSLLHNCIERENLPLLQFLLSVISPTASSANTLTTDRSDPSLDLIKAHVQVDAKDSRGVTPLHIASAKGFLLAIELLLDHGADSHTTDNEGKSVLHYAAAAGQFLTLEFWLQSHHRLHLEAPTPLDINLADRLGHTPLFYCCASPNFKCANLLLPLSRPVVANSGKTCLHAAINQNTARIKKLIPALVGKCGVKAADKDGRTALHLAAHYGYTPIVKLLLAEGADVNALDRFGKTASLFAIQRNHIPTLKVLMKAANKQILALQTQIDSSLARVHSAESHHTQFLHSLISTVDETFSASSSSSSSSSSSAEDKLRTIVVESARKEKELTSENAALSARVELLSGAQEKLEESEKRLSVLQKNMEDYSVLQQLHFGSIAVRQKQDFNNRGFNVNFFCEDLFKMATDEGVTFYFYETWIANFLQSNARKE